MKFSKKQKIIINLLKEKGGEITLEDVFNSKVNTYHFNGRKHCGDVLARMVNMGYIKRIKPGVFKLGGVKKTIPKSEEGHTKQIQLF